jgi:hypothetical protein
MKTKIVKAVLNMNKLSVPSKINKARLIVEAISTNVGTFMSPMPDLITVNAAIDDLETAWNNAADGGKNLTVIMHDKEAALMLLMNSLAQYVTLTANGNEDIVHLAAMDTKKTPTKVQSDFDVIYAADSGSVIARKKNVLRASYIWQFSTDPSAANWTEHGITTQSKTTISGLTPGVRYWFRVAVVDKDGQHPFLEPVSLIII